MLHTVIGNGQVGKAIYTHLIGDKQIFDKEWIHKDIKTPIVHICIPYGKWFTEIVEKVKACSGAMYVYIHSTVKPGTTFKIGGASYCPTLGRHDDNFTENMMQYPKAVAGCEDDFVMFEDKTDFKCAYWGERTDELEYAKIASTNYMYWNLVYQKEIAKYCKKHGYKFDKVYSAWNKSYNMGIQQEHPLWQRPVYELREERIPGGHCLPANINIVDDDYISKELRRWQDEQ